VSSYRRKRPNFSF